MGKKHTRAMNKAYLEPLETYRQAHEDRIGESAQDGMANVNIALAFRLKVSIRVMTLIRYVPLVISLIVGIKYLV